MAAAVNAAEVVIEERPFTIEAAFNATVMPEGDVAPLRLAAKAWEDFRIVEIAVHGATVEKGGLLVAFDATGIDRAIEDSRQSVAANGLAVARMERELKTLEETSPHKLDALRRAAEIAREELTHFTKTRRKAAEEAAAQELERVKQMLEGQREELRQLEKMYQADDLTEETEEIILTRQKDEVAAAEFALRMETLDCRRKIDISLPREAATLADRERDASIALRDAAEETPRTIETRKLDLAALKAKLRRDKESLAELEQDRDLFELKAPAAGVFYHGPIENGRWSPGEVVKQLVRGGRLAAHSPFAAFIPASGRPALVAFADEATARSLQTGLAGTAILPGREDQEIPVKLVRIDTAPRPDGTWRADLSAAWPATFAPATGSTARIRMTTYEQAAAISIPTKALVHDSAGWAVEVKLTDGKTERRPVKRGRVSGDNTEILSGLEIGQVIVTP
jgi:hypothetical protein